MRDAIDYLVRAVDDKAEALRGRDDQDTPDSVEYWVGVSAGLEMALSLLGGESPEYVERHRING